jgi:hypothetical protein
MIDKDSEEKIAQITIKVQTKTMNYVFNMVFTSYCKMYLRN